MRVFLTDELIGLEKELWDVGQIPKDSRWFQEPREGDAGYDIRCLHTVIVRGRATCKIHTGVFLEIPTGYVGVMKGRSSLESSGLVVAAGVIDSSYRGEVLVVVRNTEKTERSLFSGDKVAQLLILPCHTPVLEYENELSSLSSSNRGKGGFGSTGR